MLTKSSQTTLPDVDRRYKHLYAHIKGMCESGKVSLRAFTSRSNVFYRGRDESTLIGRKREESECYEVTAPCEAEPTSCAYFAITPRSYRDAGAAQDSRRRSSSSSETSTLNSRVSTFMRIVSPS